MNPVKCGRTMTDLLEEVNENTGCNRKSRDSLEAGGSDVCY